MCRGRLCECADGFRPDETNTTCVGGMYFDHGLTRIFSSIFTVVYFVLTLLAIIISHASRLDNRFCLGRMAIIAILSIEKEEAKCLFSNLFESTCC